MSLIPYSETPFQLARIFPGGGLSLKSSANVPTNYFLKMQYRIHFVGFDPLPIVCVYKTTDFTGFLCPFAGPSTPGTFDMNVGLNCINVFTGDLSYCEDETYAILKTRCEETPISEVGGVQHNCVLEAESREMGQVIMSRMLLKVCTHDGADTQ